MECAPPRPPSGPWKFASALTLALCLVLCGTQALAQCCGARSVSISPVSTQRASGLLASAVTEALVAELSQAGFAVTEWVPIASTVPEWGSRVTGSDTPGPQTMESAGYDMAVASGADVALLADLAEDQPRAVLRAELVGSVSQRRAKLEVSAPGAGVREDVAQALASEFAARLTPELWQEIGADEAGRRAAAPARFLAGQTAAGQGRPRAAAREFAAAVLGDPGNPVYLRAAADAYAAIGNHRAALEFSQTLGDLLGEDLELFLRTGDLALRAAEPTRAEAAFMNALRMYDPPDARALEGLARTARLRGEAVRAHRYYADLVSRLPALAGEPSWLPALLAAQTEDTLRLAGVPEEETSLQLGRLYLRSGHYEEGMRAVSAYQKRAMPPLYSDADYLAIAAGLDEESERIARRVGSLTARPVEELDDDETEADLDRLHQRSDRLATLAEGMQVSPFLDLAHRYRVLAYNLLNQSNFEGLMYSRTHDADRERRASLLRDAFRKARSEAQRLGEGLAGEPR